MNIYAEYYLAHHGIKDQKWGVRRYQNKDGTLTKAGKKRRTDFEYAKKTVVGKMSNSYSKFVAKPIDISSIKARGNVSNDDAALCAKLAMDKFDRANKIEPKITKDVVSSVSDSGSTMYGLEYRLKQPTSMAGKIASDAKEKGLTYEQAANGIKDSIRYTSISDPKDFVKKYNSIKESLESKGYTEIKCKNYYQSYKEGKVMHKAIQSTYADENGNPFELQFHTPSSQAAKELKIPLYEERRQTGIGDKRAKELELEMRRLAEKVKDPTDVYTILSHSDDYLSHDVYQKSVEDGKNIVKRIVKRVDGLPVSFFDVMGDKSGVAISIGTRAGDKYRNKGYGTKVALQGKKWLDKHADEFDRIVWWARKDNTGSIKTAERIGFELDKSSVLPDDPWVKYQYKK